jgi:hypothetical protein
LFYTVGTAKYGERKKVMPLSSCVALSLCEQQGEERLAAALADPWFCAPGASWSVSAHILLTGRLLVEYWRMIEFKAQRLQSKYRNRSLLPKEALRL